MSKYAGRESARTRAPQKRGAMACPECDGPGQVLNVRHVAGQRRTVRYHLCLSCSARWRTDQRVTRLVRRPGEVL